MYIQSINQHIKDQWIITDIDDCLMFTTKSILKHRLNNKRFWFNPTLYQKKKESVFKSAQLTKWGVEFKALVESGFTNYILLTKAKSRADLIAEIFGIDKSKLFEGMLTSNKANYLNNFDKPCLYIDDKTKVRPLLTNKQVVAVKYVDRLEKQC